MGDRALTSGRVFFIRGWSKLRYRLSEWRSFLSFPMHLSLPTAGAGGLTVVLFGIPYADWNALLSDIEFWRDLGGVSTVWRLPAFAWLLSLFGSASAVVVPMKSAHCRDLPAGRRGLFPCRHSVSILDDKRAFQGYIDAHGLAAHCPRSYASPAAAEYPCVVKRLDTSGSIGVKVARSREHLAEILRQPIFVDRSYVLQELVPGTTEHASFFICRDGRVLWHWTFASTMSGPAEIKSEENDKNRLIVPTPAAAIAGLEAILAPLGYCGPCIANYKIAPDGRPRFFEINPRFGGSLLQRKQKAELREAMTCILANASAR